MFIYKNKNNNLDYIETLFKKENFLHLTGIEYTKSAKEFYQDCLKGTISPKDIKIKDKVFTKLKLDVLESAVTINKCAKSIGDFNNNSTNFKIEKVIGGVVFSIGFSNHKKDGQKLKYYYPKTLLKNNIKHYSVLDYKIVAIFSKQNNETIYDKITYLSNNIIFDDILKLEHIYKKINIEKII